MVKKLVVSMVSLLMVLGLVISCGGDSSSSDSSTKTKVLKVYLAASMEKKGQAEVFAAANKMLETKLPGVQMDVTIIPYGNWAEKWKLLTAAGDQMDVAWIGWMLNFDTISREGMLNPLDDLIANHAPEMMDVLPQFVLDKATVDGSVYAVPNYQQMVEHRRGIRLYKHLADNYVDVDALEAQFTSDLTFDQDDWDALEPYFAGAKRDGLLQRGLSISYSLGSLALYNNGYEALSNQTSPVVVRIDDPDCTVINRYTTPQYVTMIKTLGDWYKKGYIEQDILAIASSDKFRDGEYTKGGNISWVHETLKDQSQKDTKRAQDSGNDVEIVVVPTADYQYLAPYGTPTNLAIPFTAKYPEEAIQLISLLNTDPEFYNLMVYGLEGKHYEKSENGTIRVLDADSYQLANWATGNTLIGYEIEGGVSGWSEYLDEMHRSARQSKLMGLKINTEPYATQLQQIDTIVKEYQAALEFGALGDGVMAKYEEFIAKLEKAGIQKVIDGFQEQIDDFLDTK